MVRGELEDSRKMFAATVNVDRERDSILFEDLSLEDYKVACRLKNWIWSTHIWSWRNWLISMQLQQFLPSESLESLRRTTIEDSLTNIFEAFSQSLGTYYRLYLAPWS